MEKQNYTLIQKESWATKINSFFGIIWKILLVFIIVSLFLGGAAEESMEEIDWSDEDFSIAYLDEDGLVSKNIEKNGASQIALIDISGIIAENEIGGMFDSLEQKRSDTIKKLQYIKNHPEIKGVILRINSPGGTVYDSDIIAEKVADLKKTGVKIVALLEEQATSGGYYIASQADVIVAHELTLTGSIGSIIELPNAEELLNKVGVKFNTIASGKNKAMGSFNRTMNEEEQEIFQLMIDESYQRFIDFVEAGREIPREELLKIADGRIYTGKQAYDLKLVDALGRYPESLAELQKLLELEKIQVFELNLKKDPYELFFESFGNFQAIFNKSAEVEALKNLKLQSQIFYM